MITIFLDEKQFKVLLKQTLIELFDERRDIFSSIVVEALEDGGLAHAIRAGRKNVFVSGEEIRSNLQAKR